MNRCPNCNQIIFSPQEKKIVSFMKHVNTVSARELVQYDLSSSIASACNILNKLFVAKICNKLLGRPNLYFLNKSKR
jgi:hypothetical protein